MNLKNYFTPEEQRALMWYKTHFRDEGTDTIENFKLGVNEDYFVLYDSADALEPSESLSLGKEVYFRMSELLGGAIEKLRYLLYLEYEGFTVENAPITKDEFIQKNLEKSSYNILDEDGYLKPPEELEKINKVITYFRESADRLTDGLNRLYKELYGSVAVTFPEKDKAASLLITHKDYKFAFRPQKNKHAYIVDFDKQLKMVFDEYGNPIELSTESEEDKEAYNATLNKKKIASGIADTDLLETLAAAVKAAYVNNYGDKITVYLPNFAKALGVQFETRAAAELQTEEKENVSRFSFWDKIKELENIGGVLVKEEKILRVFVLQSYDGKKRNLTFSSPYLYELMNILKKEPANISKKRSNDSPLWSIEGVSYLVKANIQTARNKATVQIVKNLIVGIHQYGPKPEAKRHPGRSYKDEKLVEYCITYKGLIERTPLLREALETAKNSSNQSQILTRSILGPKYGKPDSSGSINEITIIEEYLRKYTFAFDYWKDLKISCDLITLKTLGTAEIKISHHGINGTFENPLQLPKTELIGP